MYYKILEYFKINNKIKKSSFLHNIRTILIGNLSGQLATFILAPIITRIYLPEHFGIMSVIISFVSMITIISCGRYDLAIVLPKEKKDSQYLVCICLSLTVIISIIILLLTPLLKVPYETLTKVKGVGAFIFLVPLGILAEGWEQTFRHWFVREKIYKFIAKTRIFIPVTGGAFKIITGLLLGSSALWLILGDIIGFAVVATIMIVYFLKDNYTEMKNNLVLKDVLAVAKKYNKFPKYNLITAFMGNLSNNLPTFLLALFFSYEIVGYYALARKILKKPVELISNSIREVLLQRIAEIRGKGNSPKNNFVKSTIALAVIGIIPFGTIIVWGETIFAIIFGEKWTTAGLYARILAPWLYTMFINPPSTQLILVDQKLFKLMVYSFVLLCTRSSAIVAGYYISSEPWVAITLFSGVGVIANILLILYSYKLSSVKNLPNTNELLENNNERKQ
jgi:O-antigen/teichoic acid export membrane protein